MPSVGPPCLSLCLLQDMGARLPCRERAPFKGGPAALLWGAVSRCWTFSLSCSLSCREQPCEVLPGGWAKWGMMTNTFPVMGRTWPGAGQTTWPPHPTRQVLLPKAHCAAELSLAFQDPARPAHLAVRACCPSHWLPSPRSPALTASLLKPLSLGLQPWGNTPLPSPDNLLTPSLPLLLSSNPQTHSPPIPR